jgi:hypothetical protein
MANVFAALNKLKTNIFGGPGNTGFTKPPASRVQDIDLQESPTGKLNVDPLSVSTLSYPMDVQQNFQNGHYMLFYVNVQDKTKYTYAPTKSTKISDYATIKGESNNEARYQKLNDIKKGVSKQNKDVSAFLRQGKAGKSSETKKGVSALFNNTRRISDSIALYLPPNVEDNTTAGYNDFRTGIAGYLATAGVNMSQMTDAETLAKSLVASSGQLLDKAAKKAVSELAEVALGSEGSEQLINKAFGQADNPYMEVLFDAMALRTFTYNFNFAPKNEQEAHEVQKIIQVFRFHMAPELRGGQSRFLGLPSQFDIHYMFLSKDGVASENNYYNRIATCVLQNCAVNYTPTGVKSFEDGGPTTTTMQLVFKETELLTKDLIAQGY